MPLPDDPTDVPTTAEGGPSWFEKEALQLLKRSIDTGIDANKDALRTMRELDKGAVSRHGELVTALRDLLVAIKGEPKPPPSYPLARMGEWLERRPAYIQNGVAVGGVIVCLQLVGALYERLTGHAPPQVTVPTSIVSVDTRMPPVPDLTQTPASAPAATIPP